MREQSLEDKRDITAGLRWKSEVKRGFSSLEVEDV